jgi:hypothetical protein
MADTRNKKLEKKIQQIAFSAHKAGPEGERLINKIAKNHVDDYFNTHTTSINTVDAQSANLENRAKQFERIKIKEEKESCCCWSGFFNLFSRSNSTGRQDTRYHKLVETKEDDEYEYSTSKRHG